MVKNSGGLAVALGTFDGFHIGHKMVIDKTKLSKGESAVLLFDEHPQKVLSQKSPGELITKSERDKLLEKWSVTPITISFSEIMSLSYEDFFYKILLEKIGATALSCGFNYRFGAKANGNAENLKTLCQKEGIELFVSEAVKFEGEPVSSTRIRNLIKQGDIESANAMLGREFSYDFLVVHGDARGRTIDSPTINQFFSEDFIVPEYGVYASFSVIDGKRYPSVTNIGIRPTIGNSVKRSETNIVGYDGDLYDENISVHLLKKIRNEIKFSSLDELRAQIAKDRELSVKICKEKGKVL